MILSDYTEIRYDLMFKDLLSKGRFDESIKEDVEMFKRVNEEHEVYFDENETERNGSVVNITYGDEWGKSPSDPDGEFIAFYIQFDYRKEKILSCTFDN